MHENQNKQDKTMLRWPNGKKMSTKVIGDLQRGKAQHNEQVIQGEGGSSPASPATIKLEIESLGCVLAKSPLITCLKFSKRKILTIKKAWTLMTRCSLYFIHFQAESYTGYAKDS